MTDRKPHPHARVIKAFADGHDVQYLVEGINCWLTWVHDRCPSFFERESWRVKPKEDVVLIRGVRLLSDTSMRFGDENNLKLIFDGETGDLKSAEVIK